MLTLRKNVVNLYVDRASQQWIVLDGEGNYWLVPGGCENPWNQHQPSYANEETAFEPVPGHYEYMLGLPTLSPQTGASDDCSPSLGAQER